MKVLVAEDDVTSRVVLQRLLTKWGYDPICAADGQEAWAILEAPDAPRLAIVDWMMPGLDGAELCRLARSKGQGTMLYILMLTALNARENIIEGLDAGADDYVTKPFDAQELRARLRVGQRMVALETALAQRIGELEGSLAHIKTLQGLLPICAGCKKIRDSKGYWNQVEVYIRERTDATFSHGLCPTCMETLYPDLVEDGAAVSPAPH